jgi:hypothetical protein
VSVPAKVILAFGKAVQVTSAAQPLAQLARDRAESIFAHVGCVVLVSEKLCQNHLWKRHEITHIGTRHIPGHVKDFLSGNFKFNRSQGWDSRLELRATREV